MCIIDPCISIFISALNKNKKITIGGFHFSDLFLDLFGLFFENRRRGLARLLKLYKVVILTEKGDKKPLIHSLLLASAPYSAGASYKLSQALQVGF